MESQTKRRFSPWFTTPEEAIAFRLELAVTCPVAASSGQRHISIACRCGPQRAFLSKRNSTATTSMPRLCGPPPGIQERLGFTWLMLSRRCPSESYRKQLFQLTHLSKFPSIQPFETFYCRVPGT